MDQALCCDCGQSFHRAEDESWKVRCISCFKRVKRGQPTPTPTPTMTSRIDAGALWKTRYLEADAQCFRLQSLVDDLRAQLAARPAFDAALVDELREMLPRLRRLCHPDRHGGSIAANNASQWLNAIRERLH